MLEQFVAVMPGTLAPALLVMSLSVMLTVGEGRDKPISSHWRLIGLIVGLIAAIVFAGLRASAVINQRTFVNYPVLWCAIIADILTIDFDHTRTCLQLTADQTQQRGLAAAAAAHDRHHLAAMHIQVDAAEHRTLAIGEVDVAQGNERGVTIVCVGHGLRL